MKIFPSGSRAEPHKPLTFWAHLFMHDVPREGFNYQPIHMQPCVMNLLLFDMFILQAAVFDSNGCTPQPRQILV